MSSAVDVIESTIGRFGKYQTWITFLILVGRIPTEFQISNVVFILPSVEYVCMDEDAYNLTNHCPCQNPEYDQSTIVSSVTSTFSLICERGHLASLAQSILQIGILAGSLLYGFISDRYGRLIACLLALLGEVVFTALSAVVTEFWMFIVCRFLIGTAAGGTMLCCYIILIEFGGKSFRPYLCGLNEISYILAYFTLPVFAYFIRDWRQLQLATSLPWLFVIFYYFVLPESPRWLISMGHKERAIDILTHIANKNKLPTENIKTSVENIMKEIEVDDEKQQQYSYLDLFKTPKVRTYTIIMALIWMCCSNVFFGVNQYIGRLQGDIYLNVMISAACHVPGLIVVVLASIYLRRKISVVTSFIAAGLSLLVFLFIPSDMTALGIAFVIIGLTSAYTAFIQIYLFSSEIFPTVIRNSAMGFASVFARVGGLIAPFIVNIGVEWISILIFSSLAVCAGLFCIFLPETKGTVLLSTIDETEKNKNRN